MLTLLSFSVLYMYYNKAFLYGLEAFAHRKQHPVILTTGSHGDVIPGKTSLKVSHEDNMTI